MRFSHFPWQFKFAEKYFILQPAPSTAEGLSLFQDVIDSRREEWLNRMCICGKSGFAGNEVLICADGKE